MILITGAAGKTGQAVIQALVERNAPVRAFVYRPEQVARVKGMGVQDVVVGDMVDDAAFTLAAQGVRAMYHICSNMNPEEVRIVRIALGAARTAGVRHFVYHSVLHPQTEKMPHHWQKMRSEELIFESGLDFTILQPVAYMQNVHAGWQAIVEQGVYRVPYPVNTRLAMVDLRDVAAVAAAVLTEPGHVGATYELAGPDVLTQTEVAGILSESLGRPVRAERIPLDEWTESARQAGLADYQTETLVKMFRYYEQFGFRGNANVLGWLLKRPPTPFRAFVERTVGHKMNDVEW